MKPSGAALSWAAFAAITAIWGTTFLAIRVGNEAGHDPLSAVALRLLLAAPLLLLVARWRGSPWPRPGPERRATLLAGLLIFGINFPLLYWGELTVPSGMAAVSWGVYPVLVALGAPLALAGREPLTARGLAGAGLALAGLVAVFWSQLTLQGPVLGFAAILAGIVAAVGATLVTKRWCGAVPTLMYNGIGSALGALVLVPLAALQPGGLVAPPNLVAAAALLFLLLAASLGAFPLWAWLIHRWPATRVSFQTVLSPVLAVALGVAVLGEPLHASFLLGAALVLLGTTLALRDPAARAPAGAAPAQAGRAP